MVKDLREFILENYYKRNYQLLFIGEGKKNNITCSRLYKKIPALERLNNTMIFFFFKKNKDKKLPKPSETVKISNNPNLLLSDILRLLLIYESL